MTEVERLKVIWLKLKEVRVLCTGGGDCKISLFCADAVEEAERQLSKALLKQELQEP